MKLLGVTIRPETGATALSISSAKIESVVTEVTYTLADDISPFYYKEWLNDSGKVIDSILRDKDGYEIDDPALLEEVQNFVDGLEK